MQKRVGASVLPAALSLTNLKVKLLEVTDQILVRLDKQHDVGAAGEPPFQNAWVNFGGTEDTARFWKDPWGVVHLAGCMKTGVIGTVAFTLPAGYRPSAVQNFNSLSNNALGITVVTPNGNVNPAVGAAGAAVSYYLSGITFRAA